MLFKSMLAVLLVVGLSCGKADEKNLESPPVTPPSPAPVLPTPPVVNCLKKTSNPSADLHAAILENDVNCARDALKRGADREVRDSHNWTPLHSAVKLGNIELVKLMLEWKADVNADRVSRNEASTPLTIAIHSKNLPLIGILIDGGASLTQQNLSGWLPLHSAVLTDDTGVVKLLLTRGAEVDAHTQDVQRGLRRPASHIAASYGKTEILRTLVAHHADLDERDGYGDSILHAGARQGQGQISSLKFIMKNAPYLLNSRNSRKETPLHGAVLIEGNAEAIQLLLEMGANPLIKESGVLTALDQSENKGYEQLIREYLPKVKDTNRSTEPKR